MINEQCFRVLGMPSLTGRLSPNCHRVGPFSLMAETGKLQTSRAHSLSLHAIPSSSGVLTALPCVMLNISLLLPFICGYLPPLLVHPVSYGTAGGHGRNPLPTWREMCRTNGSRNYTEIGHTGWISKSRALVKVSAAR